MARLWNVEGEPFCHEMFINRQSSFRHRFGGESGYQGIVPKQGTYPVHLVMTFDLRDDRIPFKQPNLRELPLFFPFQYNGGGFTYRVVDDQTIEITTQPKDDFTEGFPYANYPSTYVELPIELSAAVEMDRYWKIEFLREQRQRAIEDAKRFSRIFDKLDQVAVIEGLMQETPRWICGEPACNKQPMNLLTVLRGDLFDGFHFWCNTAFGPDVDIIYEYCPRCFAIRTDQQCD